MSASLLTTDDPGAPPDADVVVLFGDRAGALGVTVERVATMADAANIVVRVATEVGAGDVIVAAEALAAAPGLAAVLTNHGVAVTAGGDPAATRDAPLGVSLARGAIAETGSVLLVESTLSDRAIGMLVATQVVLCPSGSLMATLEDAAAHLRAAAVTPGGGFATLVTGPSRTADIERVLTVGVQGPSRVIVVFVDALVAAPGDDASG